MHGWFVRKLAVSYTHLDVYKRQSVYRALEDSVSVNIGTVVLKDDDIQISEVTITGKLQEVVTVSYTHLDVYKRQVLHRNLLPAGKDLPTDSGILFASVNR